VSGVQSVKVALDVPTQTLTVAGADGVSVPFTDPRFVSMSGYYATAAIFYTNAATDGRVAFLSFGADSVIGGRPQIQVPSLGHRTLPDPRLWPKHKGVLVVHLWAEAVLHPFDRFRGV
jgi:hypothetical protein